MPRPLLLTLLLIVRFPAFAAERIVDLTSGWTSAVEREVEPGVAVLPDPGIDGIAATWHQPGSEGSAWRPIAVPGWREGVPPLAGVDGAVWFRCSIVVGVAEAGQAATLQVGTVDDFDIAWINGIEVGRTGPETTRWWTVKRAYPVPANVLVAGPNTVVVRIFDAASGGGFSGAVKDLQLVTAAGTELALPRIWTHAVERRLETTASAKPPFADEGIAAASSQWHLPQAPEGTAWVPIVIPGPWEFQAPLQDGAVWYHRSLEVGDESLDEDWMVSLGKVQPAPRLWWNGTEITMPAVGAVRIPRALLTAGPNLLALRLWDSGGPAGILGDAATLCAGPESAMADRVLRGPYLQLATATGMTVRWRTLIPTIGAVTAWDQAGVSVATLVEGGPTTEHELRLEALTPRTIYRYAIHRVDGAPVIGETSFRTLPEVGATVPMRFWIIGDSGTANADAKAVYDSYRRLTGTKPTDLWLMLGDNAYTSGTDGDYQRAVFAMYPEMLAASGLYATLGNHDGASADSATQTGPYYDIFTLPTKGEAGGVPSGTEGYYSFEVGNIHFVCLESHETDRSVGGAMHRWLEQDLAQRRQPWLIAFWHHPPYTKGSHDSDKEKQLIEMRENFLPLLERHGMDLAFTGHSHSYERTFAIDGHHGLTSTFDAKIHVKIPGDGDPASATGAYHKPAGAAHAGTVHVVAGSSGKINGGKLDHPAMVRSLNLLGSVVLEVEDDHLTCTFIDEQGEPRDTYSVIKEP